MDKPSMKQRQAGNCEILIAKNGRIKFEFKFVSNRKTKNISILKVERGQPKVSNQNGHCRQRRLI